MTRVDFYVLAQDSLQQRDLFACRLIEKAYKLGNHIYIHSEQIEQAKAFDQLLWSWKKSSFIPHQLETTNQAEHDDIQIGWGKGNESAANHNGLLINLAPTVPEFFSRFDRVAEIVVKHKAITKASRANYRFYKDRGYPLETHHLKQ